MELLGESESVNSSASRVSGIMSISGGTMLNKVSSHLLAFLIKLRHILTGAFQIWDLAKSVKRIFTSIARGIKIAIRQQSAPPHPVLFSGQQSIGGILDRKPPSLSGLSSTAVHPPCGLHF
uniref:Uncharacterized protein n=1 Tax=Ascaris lumbricoides TaxID=6252 RepID=A0A0M3HP79_ASCLU